MSRPFAKLLAGVGLLFSLALVGAGCTVTGNINADVNVPIVACTQEAKQCPNGTYVSRTGPNCEFAPCP